MYAGVQVCKDTCTTVYMYNYIKVYKYSWTKPYLYNCIHLEAMESREIIVISLFSSCNNLLLHEGFDRFDRKIDKLGNVVSGEALRGHPVNNVHLLGGYVGLLCLLCFVLCGRHDEKL